MLLTPHHLRKMSNSKPQKVDLNDLALKLRALDPDVSFSTILDQYDREMDVFKKELDVFAKLACQEYQQEGEKRTLLALKTAQESEVVKLRLEEAIRGKEEARRRIEDAKLQQAQEGRKVAALHHCHLHAAQRVVPPMCSATSTIVGQENYPERSRQEAAQPSAQNQDLRGSVFGPAPKRSRPGSSLPAAAANSSYH